MNWHKYSKIAIYSDERLDFGEVLKTGESTIVQAQGIEILELL